MTWVRDCNAKTVFGIGFRGYGEYKISENGKHTKCYKVWHSMMLRCYDENIHKEYNTYTNCIVCNEWHNYQIFAEWFYENYIEGYQLDKDLRLYGNKLYSPKTCMFFHKDVNMFFKIHKSSKNRKLPLGVKIGGNNYRSGLVGKSNSCSIKQALSDYWNYKHDKLNNLIEEYGSRNILQSYFENFFNEHYPEEI